MTILKSFQKVQTQSPELNEVQDNVFDVVTEIQNRPLILNYEFDDQTGLANDTFSLLGTFRLPDGEYLVTLQADFVGRAASGGVTGSCGFELRTVNGTTIHGANNVGIPRVDPTLSQTRLVTSAIVTSLNNSLNLFGKVDINVGTATSRDVLNIQVFAQRRNL